MTDSLWFSWSPASGDLDFYELILYNPNGTKKENRRDRDLTEWRFHGLVPGRKYTLCVVTHSGDLSNKVTGESRTGRKPGAHRQVLMGSSFRRQVLTTVLMRNKIGGGAPRAGPGLGRALCIVGKADRLWSERSGSLSYLCHSPSEAGQIVEHL